MFEAEKMLEMVLTQASVINKKWQGVDIEKMVTTQTNIDSYLSLKQKNQHKKIWTYYLFLYQSNKKFLFWENMKF